ncbi:MULTISPECIES: FAD-dependent monooxygenase [unclassified Streptomyces]|uniref:FAD-dependent monooxygenase n=1 Tax=unclassified Streptomyces TaxID=2593676 RepID=UPI00225129B6|nr:MULTISPECIES: FAD-dependent monooxygenase [unclassified Streptomyces]MCX5439884.1 FAD-dependent monooxygenase [Streptomyces sp. NBC_00063]WUB93691.1 FAD-dependent monooxygenase [Streptomyces sp. NBC_00569]
MKNTHTPYASTRLSHLDVLVSGASVAGPAVALALSLHGARVTVVEKAPALREGGFAVDFRGWVHRTVLTALGIHDDIHARQTRMGRQTVVDADGTPRVDLPAELMSGDVEIFRGDLAHILYEHSKDAVKYVFGDSIATLTEDDRGVDVTFEHAAPRRFDLVVAADGLHSPTRRLVFGDESRYLRFLDHYVAGFGIPNHLGLDRTGRLYSDPGRAVSVSNYDGDPDRAGALLVFRSEPLDHDRRDVDQQKRILAERFAGMGWEAPRVLEALEDADDLYFDAIAQIHVERLTKGRVVLLGDAGYGATMGGMGTGVAIVGAYVLAGELALAGGDHRTAFAAYEAQIGDFAKGCQKISGNAGPFFAPPTERRIRSRDRMYRLLSSRLMAGFFKRLTEKAATAIDLKDYPALLGAPAAAVRGR